MPPIDVTFTETPDPAVAGAWFADVTQRHPQALSVTASVVDILLIDPRRHPNSRWWAGRVGGQAGEVIAAFMHTPPRALHVGWATPEHARALAVRLAEGGHSLPGVGGERDAAVAFAATWAALTGAVLRTVMELGVYDLPVRPTVPFDVEGSFRLATDADLPRVDSWATALARAVDPTPRGVPTLAPSLAEDRVGLWQAGGRPVSMAYRSRAYGGVTRVTGVWTPPELRGHGYASAVVAELSRLRSAAGERCMLHTDLANPTSNAIYQAIGYRRIADNVSIEFA